MPDPLQQPHTSLAQASSQTRPFRHSNPSTSSPTGFSLLPILLIVLIVALLALGGVFVWQRNQDNHVTTNVTSKDEATIDQKIQKDTEKTEPQSTKKADPSEGGKYLVIAEWGVRFLLPQDLQGDVTYGIEQSSTNAKAIAWFEVGKIAQLPGSKCKLTNTTESGMTGKRGGIGAFLIKTKERIPDNETAYYYTPAVNMNVVGGWFTGGLEKYSDSCMNADEAKQQLAGDVGASLVYSLEHLEALPQP